ncbi:hypothetical protein IQ22_04196 [Pseudomonas duriflava]|uniref:Uncharacterized protein n=1 Tax=Pseudomonas duriflava TaxID=459528 RepID=A0A562PUG8_9PSED|nr:hypothetical protein IQ22_04196 [Pseudomonas duriflava]
MAVRRRGRLSDYSISWAGRASVQHISIFIEDIDAARQRGLDTERFAAIQFDFTLSPTEELQAQKRAQRLRALEA